ncbi:Brassinosteroid LRR receptor kinase BRL2 [Linum perenne]
MVNQYGKPVNKFVRTGLSVNVCVLKKDDSLDSGIFKVDIGKEEPAEVLVNILIERSYKPVQLQLGNCGQLATIVLGVNGLEGPIPPQLFRSKKLQQLDLSFNFLSGNIPKEVGLCTSLQYLRLENNFLDAELPVEMFMLPNLEILYLDSNSFTGKLPDFPHSCSISNFWVPGNDNQRFHHRNRKKNRYELRHRRRNQRSTATQTPLLNNDNRRRTTSIKKRCTPASTPAPPRSRSSASQDMDLYSGFRSARSAAQSWVFTLREFIWIKSRNEGLFLSRNQGGLVSSSGS